MRDPPEYFNTKDHEVLESKTMILVFERSFWFKHLKWWKSYAKEFYTYEEDDKMIIIKNESGEKK